MTQISDCKNKLRSFSIMSAIVAILLFGLVGLNYAMGNSDSKEKVDDTVVQSSQMYPLEIINFYEGWCGTCRLQKEALSDVLSNQRYKDIHVRTVDFSESDMLKKKYNVTMRSTLIFLQNGVEVARLVGQTDKQKVADFVKSGVMN